MRCQEAPAQRELFPTTEPAATLPPDLASQLLPLLQQLLLEVIASASTTAGEVDEQDHA
jgi:hypothetical protein